MSDEGTLTSSLLREMRLQKGDLLDVWEEDNGCENIQTN